MTHGYYLAGDIGGTKTFLALLDRSVTHTDPALTPPLNVLAQQRYHSAEHGSLHAMCEHFLQQISPQIGVLAGQRAQLSGACFALPGAVIDGKCETTNLPWSLDERALEKALSCPRVVLLNDLQATAYGSLFLSPEDSVVLQQGKRCPKGTISVVAAGTGMGQSFLVAHDGGYVPMATEGGHSSFAPRTAREFALREHIANALAELGSAAPAHVSVERVLSGPGLGRIYDFLRTQTPARESEAVRDLLRHTDAGAVIGARAFASETHGAADPLCAEAVEWFASMLAAEAANVALKHFARGGVVLAGGVCAKLLPALKAPSFVQAFADKGRFAGLLREIPLRVLVNEQVGLIGAMRYATRDLAR
jgi:glucokinase